MRSEVWKIVLPLAVLAVAAGVAAWLVLGRDRPEPQEREPLRPIVRTESVVRGDVQVVIRSQGTVAPRTETSLAAEVAGRIVRVSPEFEPGGFVREGQVLVAIDDADHRQALVRAHAEVAEARLELARQRAEAELARMEWNELGAGRDAGPLTLREPQLTRAEAGLDAAIAAAERAERDLARTVIRAPYDGRVRARTVDVGRFVAPGAELGALYGVEAAEVRLPLPDEELAFLELSEGFEAKREAGPDVTLRARFAGAEHTWTGRVVRSEGVIDPRSRMVHVVARIDRPYRSDPPLTVGMFVEAEIRGKTIPDAVRVPREAVRGDGRVLVVDEGERLRFREIDVVRASDGHLVVTRGLTEGERLCLSPLTVATEGMQVRIGGGDT